MDTLLNPVSPPGVAEIAVEPKSSAAAVQRKLSRSAFGYPREFLDNRFVYLAISPRARGLSMGVNMNPDAHCDFDCAYCEVDRGLPRQAVRLDLDVLALELEKTLALAHSPHLKTRAPYTTLPPELLTLRHVALSGDGEPTLCPQFQEAVQAVAHVRARGNFPFFKIVLITNGSQLDRTEVQSALSLFTGQDEIWAKLDAGTQQYMDVVNRSSVPLERILGNILLTARRRPVVIQSLFSEVNGCAPETAEIEQYASRLRELNEAGAKISLVQIYSATRPITQCEVRHLSLRALAEIAETVRRVAELPVF